jgi:ssDNA-specific exonuclease RecJ
MDTYFQAVKSLKYINNFELFNILNACGENVIVFSPNDSINLKDYSTIFILDSFLCEGYLANISTKFNKIYTVNEILNISIFKNLDVSRDCFGKILNSIKACNLDKPLPDIVTYFNNLRKNNFIDKNIKFNQFIFFILVMEELNIVTFEEGLMKISNNKSNLNNSSIYNFVCKLLEIK